IEWGSDRRRSRRRTAPSTAWSGRERKPRAWEPSSNVGTGRATIVHSIATRRKRSFATRAFPKAGPSLRARSARFAQDDIPGRAFLKKAIGCHPMITALLLALQLGTPPVYDRVILGGHVMDPASRLDAIRNIGLTGGRIAVITTHAISGRDTIDAKGLVVAPGFID